MSGGGRVVLVVDDDYDMRDTLSDVLTDEGFGVATAADGFEALAWLRANPPPCVILLDWMMPRCDGATFRAEQLKDPALADIPVVLLTADAHIDEKKSAIGASEHLRKPVDLRTLIGVVGKFCSGDPVTARGSRAP